MLNRLSKSAELQVKVDEDYFNMNMDSFQIRLKWENTLKSCYQVIYSSVILRELFNGWCRLFDWTSHLFQIIQEIEKQRIETLSNAVNKYSVHLCRYSQALLHVSVMLLKDKPSFWLIITHVCKIFLTISKTRTADVVIKTLSQDSYLHYAPSEHYFNTLSICLPL